MALFVSSVRPPVLQTLRILRASDVRQCGSCGRRLMSLTSQRNASVPLIPLSEVKRFIIDTMAKVGTPHAHASQLADVLAAADYRGHYSHGLNRLEMYVNDIKTGICDGSIEPEILKETAATAFVDGRNGLGPVVGNFSMGVAIKKAKDAGVGWVVAKGSNHYGIAGWYSLSAIQNGLIGLSFTNTSPFLTPTRSKVPALGTNPITIGAPAKNGDAFVLDMATSAVAVGKVEVQKRKGERIPPGWALDTEGKVTEDPSVAMKAASLLPLGGTELNSGYKGYGLATAVELFCGIMAGAAYGPNVRKWMTASVPANLGQCFVAVNPNCFAPGFEERLSDLLGILRGLPPAEENKRVLVAGDPERMHMAQVDKQGGVAYHANQLDASNKLAVALEVKPMKFL